jgi:hypothetical protein
LGKASVIVGEGLSGVGGGISGAGAMVLPRAGRRRGTVRDVCHRVDEDGIDLEGWWREDRRTCRILPRRCPDRRGRLWERIDERWGRIRRQQRISEGWMGFPRAIVAGGSTRGVPACRDGVQTVGNTLAGNRGAARQDSTTVADPGGTGWGVLGRW